jgi:hypothetical protein
MYNYHKPTKMIFLNRQGLLGGSGASVGGGEHKERVKESENGGSILDSCLKTEPQKLLKLF